VRIPVIEGAKSRSAARRYGVGSGWSSYMSSLKPSPTSERLYGGPAVVSDDVLTQLDQAA